MKKRNSSKELADHADVYGTRYRWHCQNCKKDGTVTCKPSDGIRPAMREHFVVSPTCKVPRVSIER